jgi:AraC-like DNA-binding protein
MTLDVDPDEKIYPVVKVATVIDTLAAEGEPIDETLAKLRLSKAEIASPATRVSVNQVLDCYSDAAVRSRDPHFAYRAGLRLHVSAYGMYGFAILSSMNYRQTMQFAMRYHRLATPVAAIEFKENDGYGTWIFTPAPNARIDARLYKFIVEMQFGIAMSLLRDVMGLPFAARELRVTYRAPEGAAGHSDIFGSPILFGQTDNELLFDASWLDGTPKLGNQITYSSVLALCDAQIEDFKLRQGLVGRVRQALMMNLMRPISFDTIAGGLNMSPRTLRRKLQDENTSFRHLIDGLRRDMAIQYLRDTDLTVEDIADALGFSDAANFRHAFRRWTEKSPNEFRNRSGARRTD